MKYSVTEFRKNTREILDTVDRGAEVIIQRYDKQYIVSLVNNLTLTVDPNMKLVKGVDASDVIARAATSVAKKVNKKRAEFNAVGIRTEIETELDIESGKGKITVIPDKDDVKKFKKKVGLNIPKIDPCPHGYAKGMCKKAECNRKYA